MAQDFNWNLLGLNRHQFTAYANLLALRNGGQVEPASLSNEMLAKDNSNDDSDAVTIDTSRPHQVSDSGHYQLKTKFLDCLAELTANKNGGKSVACASMMEGEETVTLWITRHEGFKVADKLFFEKLSERLSGKFYRKGTPNQAAEEGLWNEMLAYYGDRLESTYIPNLRSSLKDCNTVFNDCNNDDFATARHKLSVLLQLTFDVAKPGQTLIDRHNMLVTRAYELRRTKDVEELLQTSPKATRQTRKLWDSIYFLGRLRVAFQKFKKTSLELPSFNKVTIVPVAVDMIIQEALNGALNLRETFKLLGLLADDLTVKTVIGSKWTIAKAEQLFAKLQMQTLNIHAEVQMIMFLSKNGQSLSQLLPYFGCSKYSCFMCSHFLKAHGMISTRGCHGRLFKPWTVPEATVLASGQADRIAKAVIQLQKDIRKELKSGFKKGIPQEKTSVVGGSSVFSDHKVEKTQRKLDIERRRMKMEQERVAELLRRLSLEEKKTAFQNFILTNPSDSASAEESDQLGECGSCPRMTSRPCSVCNKDLYCSKSCENQRSGAHIFTCTKRPLTSADYLYRNIGQDTIPEEEEVLEDFGFNHLTSFADRSKLLGLYKGLYLSDEIFVEDVHKWQVEGSLVANIKRYFYKIPETHRGGYFPWFLNHINILERPTTKQESSEKLVATFYDQARFYLDKEDQHKEPNELKPDAKRQCYQLLATALHMAHPNPIEMNWYNFGFSTCSNERQECQLGPLYQTLLLGDKLYEDVPNNYRNLGLERDKPQTASFREFWHAYESGLLIQLMDSKNLKGMRSNFPYLEGFLSVPPSGPHPSVWSLKQFIAINDPTEFPPNETLKVDYGFMNCQSFEEICFLSEIYRRLLRKANPLELHEACLAGVLFEFAQKFHQMDEGHRRLMRNFYPFPDERSTSGE